MGIYFFKPTKAIEKSKDFISKNDFKFPKLFLRVPKEINNILVLLSSSLMAKVLLACGLLVTYRDYFGQEISCMISKSNFLDQKRINEFCWAEGIFIIRDSPTYQSIYPGVSSRQVEEVEKVYLRYYAWVHVSLIVQAIMFYQIKFIWICLQDDKIIKIFEKVVKKETSIYEMSERARYNTVQRVADLLYTGGNFFYNVITVEFICFCHTLFQIWITDAFLGGNFRFLGLQWLNYNYGLLRVEGDPMQRVFPRVAKCSIKRFGFTGEIEIADGECILLINNICEKIYLILWMLFHALLVWNLVVLLWRFSIFWCPCIRTASIRYTGSSKAAKNYVKLYRSPGNWYILHILSTHMTTSYFLDLMDAVMSKHFDSKGRPLYRSQFGEYAKAHELEEEKIEENDKTDEKDESNKDDKKKKKKDNKKQSKNDDEKKEKAFKVTFI